MQEKTSIHSNSAKLTGKLLQQPPNFARTEKMDAKIGENALGTSCKGRDYGILH
ncbi:MAG: hypothetical protein J5633_04995 [Oscillospiraceae bacterium]|nr:hypothetical protein [Oscillospiraceae bacterium]